MSLNCHCIWVTLASMHDHIPHWISGCRFQSVVANGESSLHGPVISGIPGSVLGSLHFLMILQMWTSEMVSNNPVCRWCPVVLQCLKYGIFITAHFMQLQNFQQIQIFMQLHNYLILSGAKQSLLLPVPLTVKCQTCVYHCPCNCNSSLPIWAVTVVSSTQLKTLINFQAVPLGNALHALYR